MVTLTENTMVMSENTQGHTVLRIFQVPEGIKPGDPLPSEVVDSSETIFINSSIRKTLITLLNQMEDSKDGERYSFTHK